MTQHHLFPYSPTFFYSSLHIAFHVISLSSCTTIFSRSNAPTTTFLTLGGKHGHFYLYQEEIMWNKWEHHPRSLPQLQHTHLEENPQVPTLVSFRAYSSTIYIYIGALYFLDFKM